MVCLDTLFLCLSASGVWQHFKVGSQVDIHLVQVGHDVGDVMMKMMLMMILKLIMRLAW